MSELALLYHPGPRTEAAALKRALLVQKLRIRAVAPEELGKSVGALAGVSEEPAADEETDVPGSAVLVLCGLNGRRLDQVLAGLRRSRMPRSVLVAVLTESNARWSFSRLCRELSLEREAAAKGESAHESSAQRPTE